MDIPEQGYAALVIADEAGIRRVPIGYINPKTTRVLGLAHCEPPTSKPTSAKVPTATWATLTFWIGIYLLLWRHPWAILLIGALGVWLNTVWTRAAQINAQKAAQRYYSSSAPSSPNTTAQPADD